MPTNRRRTLRTSRRIPTIITDEVRDDLRLRDYMGLLTEEEIPLAKKLGLYKWDAFKKEERERRRQNA
jgi:hypothetical protein